MQLPLHRKRLVVELDAGNAVSGYPTSLMPGWLQVVSHFNPLTYQVDGLRALMIQGGISEFGFAADCVILTAVFFVLVWIAARLYPRMVA